MKAISVRQPWAWAIIHAGKDIENRSWKTNYRGPLLIHAGANYDADAVLPGGVRAPAKDALDFSAIIGIVELSDVVQKSESIWFEGPYGFVLQKPRTFKEVISCAGQRGLWMPTAEQIYLVNEMLKKNHGYKTPKQALETCSAATCGLLNPPPSAGLFDFQIFMSFSLKI